MLVETGHVLETLLARSARHLEALPQVQSWVFGVDVSFHLRVGRRQHAAGGARVPTFACSGQVLHAAGVRGLQLLLALLGAHAGTRRLPAALNGSISVHAVVVSAVKLPVVLQELSLRLKVHAVAQAAEVEALHPPAVLVGAVPAHGRLLEELLGAVPAGEPLKAVAACVAAVLQDGLLRVEDVLAHPAHPRLLLLHRGGVYAAGGGTTGGGLRVHRGRELLGHFQFGDIRVPRVVLRHVRRDVFVPGQFQLAFAAVEEDVGEVRSPVKAAHVQAGDGQLLHVLPADTALMENLVGGKEMLPGCGFFGEAQATLTAPAHRSDVVFARAWFRFFSRAVLIGVPALGPLLRRGFHAAALSPLLRLSLSACGLRLTKPAVLKDGFLHRVVHLHAVTGRILVARDFGLAEEELAAEGALASHLQLLHHLHNCFVSLGYSTAVSAVHAGRGAKKKKKEKQVWVNKPVTFASVDSVSWKRT